MASTPQSTSSSLRFPRMGADCSVWLRSRCWPSLAVIVLEPLSDTDGQEVYPVWPTAARTVRSAASWACCSSADLGEGVEGGFIGVGKGVEVFLRSGDAGVAKAFFDDLEVCPSGQEPGGVRVA